MEKIQKHYVNLISENNLESAEKQMKIRDNYAGAAQEKMLRDELKEASTRNKNLWFTYQNLANATRTN
jgi:hypothetical protein